MNTLITKSLLTSLCQREGINPSLAKRGKGRFFNNDALLMNSLVISLFLLISMSQPATSLAQRQESIKPSTAFIERQRDKAGLYLRLSEPKRKKNPDYFFRHPLVDAVIATFKWSEIEPKPGQYDFSEMDKMLALAKKYRKGIIFAIATYGQDPKASPTPAWLYDKGVKRISFHGGGVSKGELVSVPKAWDDAYFREYEKLVRKVGERYANESSIWYIEPGFGHIGTTVAQPSKEGGPAFLKEGWTPVIWKDFCLRVVELYQKTFPKIPLLVKSSPALIKDRRHKNYSREADEILIQLAQHKVSVITLGLDPDIKALMRQNVLGRLVQLSSYALNGQMRVGIGDDWPLWVPKERRGKKFLSLRDESGLGQELRYAFGGVEGLPRSNISILYVLEPEIEASHPDRGNKQNKEVYKLLETARKRLKEEDHVKKSLNNKPE